MQNVFTPKGFNQTGQNWTSDTRQAAQSKTFGFPPSINSIGLIYHNPNKSLGQLSWSDLIHWNIFIVLPYWCLIPDVLSELLSHFNYREAAGLRYDEQKLIWIFALDIWWNYVYTSYYLVKERFFYQYIWTLHCSDFWLASTFLYWCETVCQVSPNWSQPTATTLSLSDPLKYNRHLPLSPLPHYYFLKITQTSRIQVNQYHQEYPVNLAPTSHHQPCCWRFYKLKRCLQAFAGNPQHNTYLTNSKNGYSTFNSLPDFI